MTDGVYLDGHAYSRAFLPNQLERLVDLATTQGETLLADAGLEFPSRAVSTVLLLGERGERSTADIADTLKQAHQVVTQRVELLMNKGLVERIADPADKRRKVLKLTATGEGQYQRLRRTLALADAAFAELNAELGCDLQALVARISDALKDTPIAERVQALAARRGEPTL